jgi:NAD-dependent SIR2 family protein deacetylase
MADSELKRAAQIIREADGLLITAGAGMGVDSGLPDFRGADGFWRAYPALARAGLRFETIASPESFRADPRLAWGFYGHRLNLYRATVPHEGFHILRRWAAAKRLGAFVFTSNVDGHFQKAGFAPEQVAEAHGSIHHLQCSKPCSGSLWPAEGFAPVVDENVCRLVSELATCPRCGAVARPNILMFGDYGWIPGRTDGQLERLKEWTSRRSNLAAIEMGAGSAVPTVRMFTERCGHPYVRINTTEAGTRGTKGVGIPGGALEVVRQLAALVGDCAGAEGSGAS